MAENIQLREYIYLNIDADANDIVKAEKILEENIKIKCDGGRINNEEIANELRKVLQPHYQGVTETLPEDELFDIQLEFNQFFNSGDVYKNHFPFIIKEGKETIEKLASEMRGICIDLQTGLSPSCNKRIKKIATECLPLESLNNKWKRDELIKRMLEIPKVLIIFTQKLDQFAEGCGDGQSEKMSETEKGNKEMAGESSSSDFDKKDVREFTKLQMKFTDALEKGLVINTAQLKLDSPNDVKKAGDLLKKRLAKADLTDEQWKVFRQTLERYINPPVDETTSDLGDWNAALKKQLMEYMGYKGTMGKNLLMLFNDKFAGIVSKLPPPLPPRKKLGK